MLVAVGIVVGVGANFPGEGAIHVGEIAGSENHADDPPDDANFQAVIAGLGVGNGQRVHRIASGQDHRIDAENHAGEHAEEIDARRKESIEFLAAAQFELHTGKSGDRKRGKNVAGGPSPEICDDLRLHLEGDHGQQPGENQNGPPGRGGNARRASANRALGFQLDPERAMHHENDKSCGTNQNGVPVEDAGVVAEPEIRPERLEEVTGFIEGDTPNHITESGAEKHGQEQTRKGEEGIPKRSPDSTSDVITELDGSAAKDQEPQNHHQREVEATEAAGVEERESEVENPAGSEKPNLVAIPNRANGGDYLAALLIRARDQEVNGTRAQVEAVEKDVHSDHYCDKAKPKSFHDVLNPPRPAQENLR